MATDRKPSYRLPRIRRGDPIRAGYLNALADGVNDYLAGPAPVRSLRVRSSEETVTEVPDPSTPTELAGQDNVEELTELDRVTTVVRVYNEQSSQQWVDVERIDRVDFLRADGSIIRLIFDW